jgi:putative hydrolase of the HAD superfamily
MAFDLSHTAVIFDLDDTLYSEADYVSSGVRYVCGQIDLLYGKNVYNLLEGILRGDTRADWLSLVCEHAGLPKTAKDSLLWMYRLHQPDISLLPACEDAVRRIRSSAGFTAVLTDGRSVTQRLKLAALGLSDLPVFISEDYGDTKPSERRFRLIEELHPAKRYVYVADNVAKDFLGCNSLGWIGIGIKGNGRNVHPCQSEGCPESALPAYWVDDWEQLTSLLFERN